MTPQTIGRIYILNCWFHFLFHNITPNQDVFFNLYVMFQKHNQSSLKVDASLDLENYNYSSDLNDRKKSNKGGFLVNSLSQENYLTCCFYIFALEVKLFHFNDTDACQKNNEVKRWKSFLGTIACRGFVKQVHVTYIDWGYIKIRR